MALTTACGGSARLGIFERGGRRFMEGGHHAAEVLVAGGVCGGVACLPPRASLHARGHHDLGLDALEPRARLRQESLHRRHLCSRHISLMSLQPPVVVETGPSTPVERRSMCAGHCLWVTMGARNTAQMLSPTVQKTDWMPGALSSHSALFVTACSLCSRRVFLCTTGSFESKGRAPADWRQGGRI